MIVDEFVNGETEYVQGGIFTNLLTGTQIPADPFATILGGRNRCSSWRTGKRRAAYIAAQNPQELSGPEISRLIRSGKDFLINSGDGAHIIPTGESVYDTLWTSSYDNGHELLIYKGSKRSEAPGIWYPNVFHYPTVTLPGRVGSSYQNWSYTGPLFASLAPGVLSGFGNYSQDSSADLTSERKSWLYDLGNKAITRSRPTAPHAALSTFLGELARLPAFPVLQAIRGKSARDLGSEYLNVQFGIKPFINDLKKFWTALKESGSIVEQIIRDAEKPIHRARTMMDFEKDINPDVYSGSVSSGVGLGRLNGTNVNSSFLDFSSASAVGIRSISGFVKFSGEFSYYFEEANNLLEKILLYAEMSDIIFGSAMSWSAIWELTPWSWLIDWFVDIQSFIGRMDALSENGLVLRYGYVTIREDFHYSLAVQGVKSRSGQPLPVSVAETRRSRYQRLRSNPYGFSPSVNLSGQQWAILAALGLTKGPRSLRIDS